MIRFSPTLYFPSTFLPNFVYLKTDAFPCSRSLVRFCRFKHDRKLALCAFAVAAAKKDVRGVFAGYGSFFCSGFCCSVFVSVFLCCLSVLDVGFGVFLEFVISSFEF